MRLIRRDAKDGWLLIPQPEHARLSGELAALWQAPPLSKAAVFAIGHHDDGWLDWEGHPRVDEASGRPVHFSEARVDEALAIWRRGPEHVAEISPYAGILVSFHGTGLIEMKLRFAAALRYEERAALQRYLKEQEDFRERVAAKATIKLADPAVERDVATLRMLDFVSLVLCCAPAETRPLEVDGLALQMRAIDETTVSLSPWPFGSDVGEIERALETIPVPKRKYTDESLREALDGAPRERLTFRFLRPGV
jgi:hypothetical protein